MSICRLFATRCCSSIAPWLVLASLAALAQTSRPTQPQPSGEALYRIAGTLVNSVTGEPVRQAAVAVLADSDSHTLQSVESDSTGRFVLENLPAAKYPLTASKRGYRTAFYDEHGEFNSAIITGPGEDTEHLLFRLPPAANVHGTVISDGGDPVEGARVMLFLVPPDHAGDPAGHGSPAQNIAQSDSVITDDTGAYDFSNLSAGRYYIAITAEPWYALHQFRNQSGRRFGSEAIAALDVAYPVTYYDSTTDEASATPVILAPGAREEANISLHAVPALHLFVSSARSSQDKNVIIAPTLQQSVFGSQIQIEAPFTPDPARSQLAEFAGLAPGHYELAQGEPSRTVELDASASQQVNSADGVATVPISGTLTADNGGALPGDVTVALVSLDGAHRPQQQVSTAHNGRFRFDGIPAGQWGLRVWEGEAQTAVISVNANGKGHAGNTIAVADHPVHITALVATGSTHLEGSTRKDGKGIAGAMIVLVPQDATSFQARLRRDQSDSDGSFSLRSVVPGSYRVVAIEDGWSLDWSQPEVLARYTAQGVPVTVPRTATERIRLREPVPLQSR